MEGLVEELLEGSRAEMAVVEEHGGAVKGVDYMKAALVESLEELEDTPGEELRRRRRAKFRGMGVFA